MAKISHFIILLIILVSSCAKDNIELQKNTKIHGNTPVEIYKYKEHYVAFCDVIKYGDLYYCTFREGENHAPIYEWDSNGYIKILVSDDLKQWKEEIIIKDEEWDLRDPCFCEFSNKLYLYYGYNKYNNPAPDYKNGLIILTKGSNGLSIEKKQNVDLGEYSNLWLWKVYFFEGIFSGVAYGEDSSLYYVESNDGIHFNMVAKLSAEGNETSLVRLNDNSLLAFIRNSTAKGYSTLAKSKPPYDKWESYMLNEMIESPESFIINDEIYVIGRSFYGMSMFKLELGCKKVEPSFNFFAYGKYGDCGYPGVIVENNHIIVIYYAVNPSTEETCIYQTVLDVE